MDRTIGGLARLRVLRLSANPHTRRFVARLLDRIRGDGELQLVTISAEVTGSGDVARATIQALGESEGTAAALALAATRLRDVEPGVWLPGQAFDPKTSDAFTEATRGILTLE